MHHDETATESGLSRRRMVALGALGGLGGATLAGAAASEAFAAGGGSDVASKTEGLDKSGVALGDPGGPRLGSAPIGGYSYVYRSFYDFVPLDNSTRVYDSYGAYKNGGGPLRATIDAPFGSLLRDMEFYLSSTAAVTVFAYLWRSQTNTIYPLGSGSVPAGAAGLRAVRFTIADANIGPYAPGSVIVAGLETSLSTQVNGVRAGFTSYPAGTTMLPAPTRVIDSRSTTKIGNGQTRIHDLSARIPAGASAAILNLSVTGGEKAGGIAVYNTGSAVPYGSAMYYSSAATISSQLHVKLPSDRKVKVTNRGVVGCKAHYFMDLVGYVI